MTHYMINISYIQPLVAIDCAFPYEKGTTMWFYYALETSVTTW